MSQLLRLLGFCVLVLALLGCEAARPPLSRSQAISAADSLLLREYLVWGNAIEVQAASTIETDGQWWQVRYPDGPNGNPRIILVDERTRWARFAGPDYVARVKAVGARSTVGPVRAEPGPWILAVDESRPAQERSQVEVDVNELNQLATRTNVLPLFSVRAAKDGSLKIIWGWQGENGTIRDEAVRAWLATRTRFQQSHWIDLTER